jgi:hypothetical protein
MKNARLYPSFLVAAAMTLILITVARAGESDSASIKFSDPSKPGTLQIRIANGDLRIRGGDVAEVQVQTDLRPESSEQRGDGLRVISSSSSYSLTEKNNVVSLAHGTQGWGPGNSSDFNITVPRNTSIIINSSLGGDVSVGGVTGNIDIKTLNGEVVLEDIAGAAVVDSMNGEIKATVRELVDGNTLSFTSINGEIALHLPATAKANVRLRTHNGSILTDFDEKALVTKTESVRVGVRRRAPRASESPSDAAQTAREEAAAARAAAAEVRAQALAAQKAAATAARDAERARARKDDDDEDEGAIAPMPPMAPLPPITGGKIVTGTLNGGGPEIRIATMNGDVTLRKIAPQK